MSNVITKGVIYSGHPIGQACGFQAYGKVVAVRFVAVWNLGKEADLMPRSLAVQLNLAMPFGVLSFQDIIILPTVTLYCPLIAQSYS